MNQSIMEKWAIKYLKKLKDIHIEETKDIHRHALVDPSCEICCDPNTKEENVQPIRDMYQCSVCNRTCHWKCLKD